MLLSLSNWRRHLRTSEVVVEEPETLTLVPPEQVQIDHTTKGRFSFSPGVILLAIIEFGAGIGALVFMGVTNPLVYLLVVAIASAVVLVIAADQRRRENASERVHLVSIIEKHKAGKDGGASPAESAPNEADADLDLRELFPPLRNESEEFTASLISYCEHVTLHRVTRDDPGKWDHARHIEYELLSAAQCCAENEREVVGELVTWDSVSVLHVLDNPRSPGDGVARSIVAPYGRLPAATRVQVRRDPVRLACEVATLALDPRVADEQALNILWRGIYRHARRGGASEVVWTLASELATLWRERFGFPLEVLSEGRRASTASAVTVVVTLAELELRLLRERPAYLGWMTEGFTPQERSALSIPIDLSDAFARVQDHVFSQAGDDRETDLVSVSESQPESGS